MIKVEGAYIVGARQTLDHEATQTNVRDKARIVKVNLLRLDL